MVSTTGHEVPGWASSITTRSLSPAARYLFFNWLMIGTDMAWPTSMVPWAKSMGPAGPASNVPMTLSTSDMAPSGQFRVQLPHP